MALNDRGAQRSSVFSSHRSVIVRSGAIESRVPLFLFAIENQRLWQELEHTRRHGAETHLRGALLHAEERLTACHNTIDVLEHQLRNKQDEVLRLTRRLDKENKEAITKKVVPINSQTLPTRPYSDKKECQPPVELLFSHASSKYSSPHKSLYQRNSSPPVLTLGRGRPSPSISPSPMIQSRDIELSASRLSKLTERTSSPVHPIPGLLSYSQSPHRGV